MIDYSHTGIIDLAAIVADHLQDRGIEVVLVGGLAVEIYTENLYLTQDIDMVNTNYQPPKRIHAAMAEIGFNKKGRVYINDTTPIAVEFPPGPLSVGEELIKNTTQTRVADKFIPILLIDDVVKDRLAAFIHWHDRQSLIQAVTILLKHNIAPETFLPFCEREGALNAYQIFAELHELGVVHTINNMADLASLLTQHLLNES